MKLFVAVAKSLWLGAACLLKRQVLALLFSEPNSATLVWKFNRAAVGVKSECLNDSVRLD